MLEQAQLLPEPPPPTEEEKLLQLMRSRAKKLVSLFEKWDRDDDGKVSKLELRKAIETAKRRHRTRRRKQTSAQTSQEDVQALRKETKRANRRRHQTPPDTKKETGETTRSERL